MKKLVLTALLISLLSAGLIARSARVKNRAATREPAPEGLAEVPDRATPMADVLRAHNVSENPDALSAFVAEAVRLTSYPVGSDRELPGFFERKVTLAVDGNRFTRRKVDPQGLREQVDLFDGQAPYHATSETGRVVEQGPGLRESAPAGAGSSIKTFSLVPVLRQFLDPAARTAYVGRSSIGEDKFDLQTPNGVWTLYADREHLIRRLESHNKIIDYADYRWVDGVRLPFIQRFSVNGGLLCELVFTRIDLHPTFAAGYFNRETAVREISR